LENVAIDLDLCEQLNEMVKNTEIHFSLYHGEEWYEPQYDFWAERETVNTKVQPVIKSAADVFHKWKSESKGAHKVMCMGPAAEIDRFYHQAFNKMGDHLHLYRSKDTYIEVAPKSISKASALRLLLEKKYDIRMDEVMAFGDNYNDIELLQQVGFGVAVANAREEVKAVANEITASNKEEGVALMIEKYLTGD
jgi:Cof subfamily protein (haloacid dehalogenase superfamily)